MDHYRYHIGIKALPKSTPKKLGAEKKQIPVSKKIEEPVPKKNEPAVLKKIEEATELKNEVETSPVKNKPISGRDNTTFL